MKNNKSKKTALPKITKEEIITAIKTVYDPEIPVDVFELGLIYDIQLLPLNTVYILMTLTSPSCPSAELIPHEIKTQVEAVPGVDKATIEITYDPPYSQDMMSESAKLELGFL